MTRSCVAWDARAVPLGPVNTKDARCVVCQKALSKTQNEGESGPGEALQRRARPFGEQPFGNEAEAIGAQRGVANARNATVHCCALRLAWHRFRQTYFFNELLTQTTSSSCLADARSRLTLRSAVLLD
jgi:hypothetical protein